MARAKTNPLAIANASSKKCSCNLGYLVIALVLFTLGIFLLVAGFGWQFNSSTKLGDGLIGMVFASYFVGLLLIALGKMAKWKCCGTCSYHNK